MPADQHRSLGASPQGEPLVAGLVDLLLDAGSLELAGEPLARLLPGLGPGDPLRAVLVASQLTKLLQLRDRSLGVERHGASIEPEPRSISLWWNSAMSSAVSAPARPGLLHEEAVRGAAVGVGLFLGVLAALWALWEGFRVVGEGVGLRVGQFEPNDRTMPHIHDIVGELFEPSGETARC